MNSHTVQRHDGNVEKREFFQDRIGGMLESLAFSWREGTPPACHLEMCLPFTRTVSSAFLSSGGTHAIPSTFVETLPYLQSTRASIIGINATLARAHKEGRLLSEIGVPWAHPSRVLEVTDIPNLNTLLVA